MLVRQYEMPWRSAYELWAGAAWLVACCSSCTSHAYGLVTSSIALGLSLFATLMAVLRIRQGLRVLTVRASLSGKAMQIITTRTTGKPDAGPQPSLSGLRLRVAAGPLAAAVRTGQDQLQGLRRLPLNCSGSSATR